MPLSLQEQLKKSGLVDDKKAKQLKRAKRKEEKLARQSGEQKGGKKGGKKAAKLEKDSQLSERKSEQVARDRQLNQEKNAKAQEKAIKAQIKQLIAKNSIPLGGVKDKSNDADKKYSFADGKKIKQLWISQQQVDQLGRGSIVIVRDGEKYALVPAVVAEKIEQRAPEEVVFKAEKASALMEDDPYADYQIPDDLDW